MYFFEKGNDITSFSVHSFDLKSERKSGGEWDCGKKAVGFKDKANYQNRTHKILL